MGRIEQLRKEKERQKQVGHEAVNMTQRIAIDLQRAQTMERGSGLVLMYELLEQANKAYAMVADFAGDPLARALCFECKGDVFKTLGYIDDALASLQQAHGLFGEAGTKMGGQLPYPHNLSLAEIEWKIGQLYMSAGQLKECECWFQKSLAECTDQQPGPMNAGMRCNLLADMTQLYLRKREWEKAERFGKEGLALLPSVAPIPMPAFSKEKFLILVANALEGQGRLSEALVYDDKACSEYEKSRRSPNTPYYFEEFHCCTARRTAKILLQRGEVNKAIRTLRDAEEIYTLKIDPTGISFRDMQNITMAMEAVDVLVTALRIQNGASNQYAASLAADIRETRAILEGYREGVLEQTRQELAERRAAAAAAATAAGAGHEGGEPKKKGKSAKRKQQKRKAQQQKKQAEKEAEAAAGGGASAGGGGKEVEEGEEEEKQGLEEATAALTLEQQQQQQQLQQQQEQQQEEEEEEEECSVCLCALEGDRGPPLLCGHSYHTLCLSVWIDRCRGKSIEPTCPYCRSSLQEA